MGTENGKKITGMNKTTDVTMKRGAVGTAAARDVEEKKLPGKRTPPTLTLKRGKNQSMEASMPPPAPEPKIPKK